MRTLQDMNNHTIINDETGVNVFPLILVGGGGHCKAVADVAQSAGWHIEGVLDVPEAVGRGVLPGCTVVGTDDDIPRYAHRCLFLVTVGFINSPVLRLTLYNKVKAAGGRLATVVAPTAHVSPNATLGEGTVVMHHAIVNAAACIGENCIVNTLADVEHEVTVGSHCHLSTAAVVNGGATIGSRCFIGSQAVIVNGIGICPDTIVGAGSVVVKDITESGIYVGNPSRKIKNNNMNQLTNNPRGGKQ